MGLAVVFVIPVFNESYSLNSLLSDLLKFGECVVVDDGSSKSLDISDDLRKKIYFLRHPINRGQGAALETGFELIRRLDKKYDYIVTFDADGQHCVRDIPNMLIKAQEGYDVVLGSRFLSVKNNVKPLKKFILRSFAKFYSIRHGVKLTDRHFGLRVLSMGFISQNSLLIDRFGHADEIIDLVTHGNVKFTETPCHVEYTLTAKKNGQPLINGVNLMFDRFVGKI